MNCVLDFVSAHSGLLSLLGIAFVVTMREELPYPLSRLRVLAWLYGWAHDALKVFVSTRGPQNK